jgi:hypothetical protein
MPSTGIEIYFLNCFNNKIKVAGLKGENNS